LAAIPDQKTFHEELTYNDYDQFLFTDDVDDEEEDDDQMTGEEMLRFVNQQRHSHKSSMRILS
jgi:hypothetical protein